MSEQDSTRIVTVYGLASSRDGEIRYIGQTVQKIKTRLRQHLHSPKRTATPVSKWIKRELSQGYAITIFPLEENAQWHVSEMALIAEYRVAGARLLNLTDGGEGTRGWHGNKGNKRPDLAERNRQTQGKPGHPSTPETNAKISAAHKGKKKPWTAERNRAMAGKLGHKHTDESRAKISAALKGRTFSQQWRDKISKKAKGRKLSEEAIAKLRAGHKAYHDRKRLQTPSFVEEHTT